MQPINIAENTSDEMMAETMRKHIASSAALWEKCERRAKASLEGCSTGKHLMTISVV